MRITKAMSEAQRLCRHCATPFRPEKIGVECNSEKCRRVRDHLGQYGPRFFFADEAGLWKGGYLHLDRPCPQCGVLDRLQSVCPHCRKRLDAERGEDQVIAVIGASTSGKSTFLATVLYQLLEDRVGRETWEVDLGARKLHSLREKLIAPLFDSLEVLESNTDQVDRQELGLPLVNRNDGRRVLLLFRDLGGELFLKPERLRQVFFLRYAQGVVLMVDPLAFGEGPEKPGSWLGDEPPPDALEVLDVYSRVLDSQERRVEHRALPLLPEQKFLALAVAKSDLMLPGDHPFWQEDGDQYLERGYWRRRKEGNGTSGSEDARAERWIRERLSPRLIDQAGSFAEVSYFFVSSLGYAHPPGQLRLSHAPRPRRVHEPIFALLDRLTAREGGDQVGRSPASPDRRGSDRGSDDWKL